MQLDLVKREDSEIFDSRGGFRVGLTQIKVWSEGKAWREKCVYSFQMGGSLAIHSRSV